MSEFQIKTILCPLDFSDASLKAARYASFLAKKMGAEITFLYVIKNPGDVYISHNEEWGVDMQVMESKYAEERMDALQKDLGTEKGKSVVAVGKAQEAIVEQAKDMNCDLIVMGSHGRSKMGKFFLGSIADMVVRKTSCPVTLITEEVKEP